MKVPGISNNRGGDVQPATAPISMTIFGIPLTGSMSSGFTIGFING